MNYEPEKLDLDELYSKNQEIYIEKCLIYNKVIESVHNKIKNSAREKKTYCWYEIPRVVLGQPKYDFKECISYVLYELTQNNFLVRYIYPNKIFIVWKHWVPSYLRAELNNKHKIKINEYGKIIEDVDSDSNTNDDDILENNIKTTELSDKQNKKPYRPTKTYRPSGVYDDEILNKLAEKL